MLGQSVTLEASAGIARNAVPAQGGVGGRGRWNKRACEGEAGAGRRRPSEFANRRLDVVINLNSTIAICLALTTMVEIEIVHVRVLWPVDGSAPFLHLASLDHDHGLGGKE